VGYHEEVSYFKPANIDDDAPRTMQLFSHFTY